MPRFRIKFNRFPSCWGVCPKSYRRRGPPGPTCPALRPLPSGSALPRAPLPARHLCPAWKPGTQLHGLRLPRGLLAVLFSVLSLSTAAIGATSRLPGRCRAVLPAAPRPPRSCLRRPILRKPTQLVNARAWASPRPSLLLEFRGLKACVWVVVLPVTRQRASSHPALQASHSHQVAASAEEQLSQTAPSRQFLSATENPCPFRDCLLPASPPSSSSLLPPVLSLESSTCPQTPPGYYSLLQAT